MNAYDQVAYINRPYSQTHPDRMAILGALHGIDAPPIETARILDLGASEGGNLIPMAMTLPRAQFTGLDLAAVPVERGNQVIRDLGLANIRLMQMNLLDVNRSFGEFDYIVAHGLYAWTPAEVRDKVLAIAGTNLSPNGLAFISYNAQPAGRLRHILRDAMLEAAGEAQDPQVILQRARAVLRLIADGRPQMTAKDTALAAEAKDVLERDDSSLFHDYLSPVFEPVSFREFVTHAAAHGLAHVADASVVDTWNPRLNKSTVEEVTRIAQGDSIRREQLLDLVRLRAFRQSVVCRASAAPKDQWENARIAGCYVASNAREIEPNKFTTPQDITITTQHPAVTGMLRRLSPLWPRAEKIQPADVELVAELFKRGLVEIRSTPGCATLAGDRPLAFPLARYQAQSSVGGVATIDHHWLNVADQASRDFLTLVDGTRDRAQLAERMGCPAADVDRRLEELGRLSLLLG